MTDPQQEIVMGLQSRPEMMAAIWRPGSRRRRLRSTGQPRRLEDARRHRQEARHGRSRRIPTTTHSSSRCWPIRKPSTHSLCPADRSSSPARSIKDLETEGQLAGVLGHEIGHVIERHSNKQMAKSQLIQGLATAGGMVGGDQQSMQMAQQAAQLISMKYGRDDELQADTVGRAALGDGRLRSAGDDRRDGSSRPSFGRPIAAGVSQHASQAGQPHRLHQASARKGVSQRRARAACKP